MSRRGNASAVGTATHTIQIFQNIRKSKVKKGKAPKKPTPMVGKGVICVQYGLGKIVEIENTQTGFYYWVEYYKSNDRVRYSFEEVQKMMIRK